MHGRVNRPMVSVPLLLDLLLDSENPSRNQRFNLLEERKSDVYSNAFPRALARFVHISPSASSQAYVITWPHARGHMQEATCKMLYKVSHRWKLLIPRTCD